MKNIVICGCVKNCEKFVDGVFENIKTISSYCNLIKIIISFDMSNDKTLFKLCNYKKIYNMDIIINKNTLHNNRVVNITNARNKYMNNLKNITETIDKFIVMDFDDVCSTKINKLTIAKVFNNINNNIYNDCCVTFNNERYYDYWALSLEEYIYSVWHTNNPKKMMYEMKNILYDKMSKCKDYITVDSAFNGFAIYDYKIFKNINYDYNINLELFEKNKISSLKIKGYTIQNNGIDCEHRLFHLKGRENNGKIIILNDFLFDPYYGEHSAFLYKTEINCNIHVCHYTPLQDRKIFFKNQSMKYNLLDKVKFLENNDREHLPNEHINIFDITKLKLSEISLFTKHIDGMKSIIEGNYEYGIIMEDDCIFEDNFLEYLTKYITNLPVIFDVIYPGFFPFLNYYKQYSGYDHPIKNEMTEINNYFYDMSDICVFPWTGNNKGTDFYIISKNGCKIILDEFENFKGSNGKISQPIDHYMGTMLLRMKANVYWTKIDIVSHGSLTIFKNSMQGRPDCLGGSDTI